MVSTSTTFLPFYIVNTSTNILTVLHGKYVHKHSYRSIWQVHPQTFLLFYMVSASTTFLPFYMVSTSTNILTVLYVKYIHKHLTVHMVSSLTNILTVLYGKFIYKHLRVLYGKYIYKHTYRSWQVHPQTSYRSTVYGNYIHIK